MAFVPFAGTDDMSRSHFETQDTIELGQPVGGHRDYGSGSWRGWRGVLGRDDRPIAFTDQLPLCFRGGADPIPNLAMANVGKPIDARQARLIEAMYAGQHIGTSDLGRSVSEGFAVRDTVFHTLDEEMKAASRGAVSARGFELSAQRIGVLMRQQFNLAFVDVGGWDTHVNQGGATGYLADRIGELGRGLAGFADSIGPEAWRTTTVVVVSEFGRTFRENGDKGTDHGHGSVYWGDGGRRVGWPHRGRADRGHAGDAEPGPRSARADRLSRSGRRAGEAAIRAGADAIGGAVPARGCGRSAFVVTVGR